MEVIDVEKMIKIENSTIPPMLKGELLSFGLTTVQQVYNNQEAIGKAYGMEYSSQIKHYFYDIIFNNNLVEGV